MLSKRHVNSFEVYYPLAGCVFRMYSNYYFVASRHKQSSIQDADWSIYTRQNQGYRRRGLIIIITTVPPIPSSLTSSRTTEHLRSTRTSYVVGNCFLLGVRYITTPPLLILSMLYHVLCTLVIRTNSVSHFPLQKGRRQQRVYS